MLSHLSVVSLTSLELEHRVCRDGNDKEGLIDGFFTPLSKRYIIGSYNKRQKAITISSSSSYLTIEVNGCNGKHGLLYLIGTGLRVFNFHSCFTLSGTQIVTGVHGTCSPTVLLLRGPIVFYCRAWSPEALEPGFFGPGALEPQT